MGLFMLMYKVAFDKMRAEVEFWHWSELAFQLMSPGPSEPSLVFLCATLIIITTVLFSNTIGGFCRHIGFIFVSFPMLFVYAVDNGPREMIILSTMNIVLFNILTLPVTAKITKALPYTKFNWGWLIVFPTLLILFTLANGGLSTSTLNLVEIYEYRRESSASQPLLVIYAMLNIGAVLIPIGSAMALHQKRYFVFFLVIVLSVLLFFFYGHKAHLVTFAFVSFIFTALMLKRFLLVIYGGISFLFLLAYLSYNIEALYQYVSLYSIGRVFVIPARLNNFWFDFFSNQPYLYWANSKLTLGLIESAHTLSGPRMIADTYSNIDYSLRAAGFANANTGWLGAGYGQAGVPGMLIYTLLGAGYVYFIQYAARFFGAVIALSALSVVLWRFLSSVDFSTALISHGVIVSIAFVLWIAWLYRQNVKRVTRVINADMNRVAPAT